MRCVQHQAAGVYNLQRLAEYDGNQPELVYYRVAVLDNFSAQGLRGF
jgi:hypothetical protein